MGLYLKSKENYTYLRCRLHIKLFIEQPSSINGVISSVFLPELCITSVVLYGLWLMLLERSADEFLRFCIFSMFHISH